MTTEEAVATRAALERLLDAVNRYRLVHSKVESGAFEDSDVTEKSDAYTHMLVVADYVEQSARPVIGPSPVST